MTEVKTILEEVHRLGLGDAAPVRNYLGTYGYTVARHVTIEAPRGRAGSVALNWFYVRVASSRRGRMTFSHFEARIQCETPAYWRIDLAKALATATEKAVEYADQDRERREARAALEGATIEYATQLGEAIGRTVFSHQVIRHHSQNTPAGVEFTVRLSGTVEQVAEKFARLVDIIDYKNSPSL